ncbi:uncharacterized protein LOC143881966 isoform X2 [Tasmannia lanceolata]|uniref:uncharacterized protein LOC143881966 isoform X2 n=1 Tax=Tasmannia lanceolata TaxID=3420 RepID=UPI0040632EE5
MDPLPPLILRDLSQSPSDPFPQQLSDGFLPQRVEVKGSDNARKLQKADREKLRRDRLNEQFLELGIALNPDRPKNDKASIIADAVEMLKELSAEVSRLKAENASLSEESSDLIQEKNELRDEKSTLNSDIESLNFQYQQRMRVMFPWTAMDPMLSLGPSPISFPTTTLTPDSHPSNTQGHTQAPLVPPFMPFPLLPSVHPFPFFSPAAPNTTNPYFSYPPYAPHVTSQSHVERPCAQYPSIQPFPGYLVQLQPTQNPAPTSVSRATSGQESRQDGNGTFKCQQGSNAAESSPSDTGNEGHVSKCKAVTSDLKDGSNVISASCQSTSSSCNSHGPDKVRENSAGAKKTMDSTSHNV